MKHKIGTIVGFSDSMIRYRIINYNIQTSKYDLLTIGSGRIYSHISDHVVDDMKIYSRSRFAMIMNEQK